MQVAGTPGNKFPFIMEDGDAVNPTGAILTGVLEAQQHLLPPMPSAPEPASVSKFSASWCRRPKTLATGLVHGGTERQVACVNNSRATDAAASAAATADATHPPPLC